MSILFLVNSMLRMDFCKVLVILCFCALVCIVEAQSPAPCLGSQKICGDICCKSNDHCEEKHGKGTCYASGTKVDCDFMYYCYSPTTCCGFGSCCPANSTCCGLNTCCGKESKCCSGSLGHCCPEDSICCGLSTCCPLGSTCKNGFQCVASSSSGLFTSRWYVGILVLIPIIVMALIIRQRLLQRRRNALYAQQAQAQNAAVQPTPLYNYEPSPMYTEQSNIPGSAPYVYANPPPYEEVVKSPDYSADNPVPVDGQNDSLSWQQQPPPSYDQHLQQPSEQGQQNNVNPQI